MPNQEFLTPCPKIFMEKEKWFENVKKVYRANTYAKMQS